MGMNKKMLRRGISELVVILIIVVIAVVAGLGIRAWLSAQMAKTPTTEMAAAEWSATIIDIVINLLILIPSSCSRT
jgi:flagellar basal body-associated protein FliL